MPIFKKINQNFFKVWTPNMAYILGFFAADGYMTLNKRGAHFWSIQITDEKLLEEIRRTIGSEHKISVINGTGNEKILYRLQIGSKEMFDDLLKLGFTQGKTKSMAVPQVPALFFRDFVRGYFDGDGNVWVGYIHRNRPKTTLTIKLTFTSCSSQFLIELRRRLRLHLVFSGVLSKSKNNCYRLTYSVRNSLKLSDFMYNHMVSSDKLFLDRKKNRFDGYKIRGRSSIG